MQAFFKRQRLECKEKDMISGIGEGGVGDQPPSHNGANAVGSRTPSSKQTAANKKAAEEVTEEVAAAEAANPNASINIL